MFRKRLVSSDFLCRWKVENLESGSRVICRGVPTKSSLQDFDFDRSLCYQLCCIILRTLPTFNNEVVTAKFSITTFISISSVSECAYGDVSLCILRCFPKYCRAVLNFLYRSGLLSWAKEETSTLKILMMNSRIIEILLCEYLLNNSLKYYHCTGVWSPKPVKWVEW